VIGVSFGRLLVHDRTVDPGAERRRLEAALSEARAERARAQRQLANPRFRERAPAHLVEVEREKERRYTAEVEALQGELDALGEAG
jgi:valyl-tRNA synthetase